MDDEAATRFDADLEAEQEDARDRLRAAAREAVLTDWDHDAARLGQEEWRW